jgi:PadR family transcriptional regulator, regulatory protein PadR
MAELFVPRGIQFAVLRSVAILGNRAYGTEIQEFLERNADKYLPAAQIYVALQRLQDRGLVQSNYEDAHLPTQGRKVHRRRVYSLTATGLRSLEAGLKLYGVPTPDGNGGGVFKEDGPEPA